MKIVNKVNEGLSDKVVTLDIFELSVLQNKVDTLEEIVDNLLHTLRIADNITTVSTDILNNFIDESRDISKFINKITHGIPGTQEVEEELFGDVLRDTKENRNMVEINKKNKHDK